MAAVKFKLIFSSSTVGSDKVDFSVEKSVTVQEPFSNISKVSVGTGADSVLLSTSIGDAYLYVKNMDTTNFITLKDNADNSIAKIKPLEFALIPMITTIGAELIADTDTCIAEYAFWSKA